MSLDRREWLEADGLGGFASGTVSGVRTRRYHALLLAARRPPADRFVLVNGFDARVGGTEGDAALSSQCYAPGVVHPDGAARLESFAADPWPRWTYRLPDGRRVEQEILVPRGSAAVVLSWRLASGSGPCRLEVRPFLSGRDYHALHRENPGFDFRPRVDDGGRLVFRPYAGVPEIAALASGPFEAGPDWYRSFLYGEERDRGLDCLEDLACPGRFVFDPGAGEAVLILAALEDGAPAGGGEPLPAGDARAVAAAVRERESARRAGASRLRRAGEAYIVRRGSGSTLIAGYPWFTDWGRDTFISLRGLCLATGRLDDARGILLGWAGAVSEGMLPNRFPDAGDAPEYNSVDASLWYVVAVREYLEAMAARGRPVAPADRTALADAVAAILDGYARGTRYGIGLDGDGLLRAGAAGTQLTWMDARVGDRVVTPRVGKPVEVQALWLNALHAAPSLGIRRDDLLERGRTSFARRFWNQAGGYLYDVVDPDHRPGEADAAFRPNQILAIGGLPAPLLGGERARRVVDAVETRLWTPLGLRSLAPGEPGYAPRYEGGVAERDGAYHQGTVWPWLAGPFVEAWVRVRGGTAAARRAARARFLEPLLARLDDAGLGHLPEIADADPPHRPRGCPFQAWSVAEALRLQEIVLRDPASRAGSRRRAGAAPGAARGRAFGASEAARGRSPAPRRESPGRARHL
jgi:predicted glycogen debranching enzyme